MSTGTIEKGSRVKVEFEGEVTLSNEYDMVVKMPDGKEHVIAAKSAAKVTVTEKPLPAEPPVGTIVTDKWGSSVYKSFIGRQWYRLQDSSMPQSAGRAKTWREVVAEIRVNSRAEPVHLVAALSVKDDVSLKDKPLKATSSRNSDTVTVKWDDHEFPEGRVKFFTVLGGEVFRFRPDDARRVAKAILATVGN